MIKLFGFNKKEKISVEKLAKLYANTLFDVVDNGFPEIIGLSMITEFEESQIYNQMM